MTIAWYDPTNRHVSTDKNDPMFTPLGQLWPLNVETTPHMIEEVLVAGFESRPIGDIGVKMSEEKIEFSSSTGFGRLLTNPLVTDNGQTIGERNRIWLHAKLDAWLDGTFEEKNSA